MVLVHYDVPDIRNKRKLQSETMLFGPVKGGKHQAIHFTITPWKSPPKRTLVFRIVSVNREGDLNFVLIRSRTSLVTFALSSIISLPIKVEIKASNWLNHRRDDFVFVVSEAV